jgi:hypothetical protein
MLQHVGEYEVIQRCTKESWSVFEMKMMIYFFELSLLLSNFHNPIKPY